MIKIKLTVINIIFLISVFSLVSSCAGKSSNQKEDGAMVQDMDEEKDVETPVFNFTNHNFGEIERGEEVGARFLFENPGEVPLVVNRVSTGCGCTIAEYTRQPVIPGETGFVEVVFDSKGKIGAQYQEVRVYFEGLRKPSRLTIIAQVG